MAYAELRLDPVTQNLTVTSRELVFHPSLSYWPNKGEWEKNWAAFIFNNTLVYMIQMINPLRIVALAENITSGINPQTHVAFRLVSEAPTLPLSDWEWGELRGGTNAVLVGDVYLAMFHTRPKMHNSDLITYFFGAYTFTRTPPFRLLTISNVPIVDDQFYNGPWVNRRFCYAPYPTGLWLEQDKIKVVMGFNDKEGYILTFDTLQLIESLVSVG